MKTDWKPILALILIALVIGAILLLESIKAAKTLPGESDIKTNVSITKEEKLAKYPLAKEIVNPAGFVNSDNFTIGQFIGKKVILVDFWTYSCINCQRTFPYLISWHEKYHDKGLEIIGVHTPEFEFEKNRENVEAAVKKFGIPYRIVMDNDYATWNAYRNRYWPRKYLIDIDGFIVFDHIGEGAYEDTERKIQELLLERMESMGEEQVIPLNVSTPGGVLEVEFPRVKSPEVYFGASRNSLLGNGAQGSKGIQNLTEPVIILPNTLYLTGSWLFEDEYAQNLGAGARIIFKYNAKSVYLVATGANVTINATRDGKPPAEVSGEDISTTDGTGIVGEARLYKIIEDADYGEHTLEITVNQPGLKAFTFTFG